MSKIYCYCFYLQQRKQEKLKLVYFFPDHYFNTNIAKGFDYVLMSKIDRFFTTQYDKFG